MYKCTKCLWLFGGETDESEGTSSGDVKSRLKKKAVSGLQRKDSMYYILHNDSNTFPFIYVISTHIKNVYVDDNVL